MASGTIPKNMVLAWSNPSPTANFAGQTVSVDLSKYDAIIVEYKSILGGYTGNTALCRVGADMMIFDIGTSGSNLAFIYRDCKPRTNGVTFGGASMRIQGGSGAESRNQYIIPQRIYGIIF